LIRKSLIAAAFLLIILAGKQTDAQLTSLWTVTQTEYEVGWIWSDFNGDGIKELIKEDGLGCWVYDGNDEYALVWEISNPELDPVDDELFDLWLISGSLCVFRSQSTDEQTSRIYVWQFGQENPAWASARHQGNISHGSLGDINGDGSIDIVYSWHYWDGLSWQSGWQARTLNTGALLNIGEQRQSYLIGPWIGNIEGDEFPEVLFNWYDSSGGSTLECWVDGASGVDGDLEDDISPIPAINTWPNPFNPACTIQLELAATEKQDLKIYNLAGTLVRTFKVRNYTGGKYNMIWDGMDQSGRQLPSGVYMLQAGDISKKVTLLR
jgi:hypothetical protein